MPGRVQVTQAVMERLGSSFRAESRGLIEVKGKGLMAAYLLVDRIGPRSVTMAR